MTLSVVDKLLVLRDGVLEAFGPRAEILPRLGRAAPRAPSAAQARVVPLTQTVGSRVSEAEMEGAET
jgi:ABC-type protease/lipase transport system fused ATPase/permease subunit